MLQGHREPTTPSTMKGFSDVRSPALEGLDSHSDKFQASACLGGSLGELPAAGVSSDTGAG